MTAPRVRATATVAIIVLAIALFEGGLRVSVFCVGSTHAEACAESGGGDVEDTDFSPLLCVVPARTGQRPFMVFGHVVATRSAPPRAGFHPAVDRPPSL